MKTPYKGRHNKKKQLLQLFPFEIGTWQDIPGLHRMLRDVRIVCLCTGTELAFCDKEIGVNLFCIKVQKFNLSYVYLLGGIPDHFFLLWKSV